MTDSNAARQAAGDRGEEAARTGAGRVPNDGSAPLAVLRLFLVVAVLGLVAAFAAVVFEIVVHLAQNLLWSELPNAAGWQEPSWWYVLAMPALGGLLVALAFRLPGHGGPPHLKAWVPTLWRPSRS